MKRHGKTDTVIRRVRCRNEAQYKTYNEDMTDKGALVMIPKSFPCVFVEIRQGWKIITIPVELKHFTEG